MAAGAPAHHAELRWIGDAARDERVHAGDDVVVALAEVVAGDLHAELLAVVAGAAIVGLENSVAARGKNVDVAAPVAGEAILFSAGRTAMNLNNQRIALPFFVAERIDEQALNRLAVGALPMKRFILAQGEVFRLRIGARNASPAGTVADGVRRRCKVVGRLRRRSKRKEEKTGVFVEPRAADSASFAGQLGEFSRRDGNSKEMGIYAEAFEEVKGLRIQSPGNLIGAVIPVGKKFAEGATRRGGDVDFFIAQVGEVVGSSERQPLAVGGKPRHAFGDAIVGDAANLSGRKSEQINLRIVLIGAVGVAIGGSAAERQQRGIPREGELRHTVVAPGGPAL